MLRPVRIGPDCSLSMPHARATSAPIPPAPRKIHDVSEPPLPVRHYPPDDASLSIPRGIGLVEHSSGGNPQAADARLHELTTPLKRVTHASGSLTALHIHTGASNVLGPTPFRPPSGNGDRATGVVQNAVAGRTQNQGGEAAVPS